MGTGKRGEKKPARTLACLLMGGLFAVTSPELVTAGLLIFRQNRCRFIAFDMLNSLENCDCFVFKAIIIATVGFFCLFMVLNASYPVKLRSRISVGFSQCKHGKRNLCSFLLPFKGLTDKILLWQWLHLCQLQSWKAVL